MPQLAVLGDAQEIVLTLPERLGLPAFDYLGHIQVAEDEDDGRTELYLDFTERRGTRRIAIQLLGRELWEQVQQAAVTSDARKRIQITVPEEAYRLLVVKLSEDAELAYDEDEEDFFPKKADA